MSTPFPHTEPVHSYYTASRNEHTDYPRLQGSVEVETCIIGGGLSGIGTALPLAQQQRSVALIEAAQIGYGASGRNGGQVIYGYAAEMSSIASMISLKNAQTLWQWSREAVALVEQQIQTYQIACDWQRGYAHVAIRPRHLHALTEWVKEAAIHYHFHDYQIWNQNQLQQQLASERYIGAIFDQQAGHLHPLNYTLGLARAAVEAGALLFEHSPMLTLEPWQHGYRITTPNGHITAKNLVIAVNTFTRSLQHAPIRPLAAKILPVGTYMIATAPLGERAQRLIPNNMAVCDTRFVLDYYRLSADKRLLFGGKVNYSGREPSQQQLIQGMRRDMLKVFPQLADVHIDYAWGGQVDISMNRIPHFGRLNPQLYFLQGFSGHGVAATGLGGQIIAEAISGDDSRLRLFEKITHHNFPGGKLLRLPAQWLGVGYYRLKDLLP
jgi:gamma-glutamylputrescine oxidase